MEMDMGFSTAALLTGGLDYIFENKYFISGYVFCSNNCILLKFSSKHYQTTQYRVCEFCHNNAIILIAKRQKPCLNCNWQQSFHFCK